MDQTTYGAMLVKSSQVAKDFNQKSATSILPTYLFFNKIENIESSLKLTKHIGDSLLNLWF
jgi:hypothetical protein